MQAGTLFGLLVRGFDLREIERRENEELGAHREKASTVMQLQHSWAEEGSRDTTETAG
jgi:hypothetical protein